MYINCTSLKNSIGLFCKGLGTWNCNLYGPSQSTPFVNEKIKFKATQRKKEEKLRKGHWIILSSK